MKSVGSILRITCDFKNPLRIAGKFSFSFASPKYSYHSRIHNTSLEAVLLLTSVLEYF